MTESKTLALFGGRDDVREMADRIRRMLPGGYNYTEGEALTLAQMSVAHGLDPFNGECWLIKDTETKKVYGALIGIKGQRRHAKLQSDYWGVGANGGFTRVTDPQALKLYGADGPGDVVYEYRIVDEVTLRAYAASLRRLIDCGIKLEDAQKMVGGSPVTIGIGIFKAGEKSKMKSTQAAMFRAEKDALKRRFDVKFAVNIDGQELTAHVNGGSETEDPAHEEIEAEYTEYEDAPESTEDEIIEELGFSKPPAKPAPVDTVDYSSLPAEMLFVTNSEGVLYIDVPSDRLKFMVNSLRKSLEKNHLDEAEKARQTDKLATAEAILKLRAAHHGA